MSDGPEVDVRLDLHSVDDTGYVWAFTDRIQQPTVVVPGAVVIAGNRTLRSLAQVVDFADEPAGRVVHLVAALGVVTNLLAVGAAFGVARLIFQNGHGASLFGFESQHLLDAWAQVFFFAMIAAISMDYTAFLLASAKEHWEAGGRNAREAMVGGLAHSGRVIFAAAVMIAVFFTFALSGPLPPKEMRRRTRHRRAPRRAARPPDPATRVAPPHRPRRLGLSRRAATRPAPRCGSHTGPAATPHAQGVSAPVGA